MKYKQAEKKLAMVPDKEAFAKAKSSHEADRDRLAELLLTRKPSKLKEKTLQANIKKRKEVQKRDPTQANKARIEELQFLRDEGRFRNQYDRLYYKMLKGKATPTDIAYLDLLGNYFKFDTSKYESRKGESARHQKSVLSKIESFEKFKRENPSGAQQEAVVGNPSLARTSSFQNTNWGNYIPEVSFVPPPTTGALGH